MIAWKYLDKQQATLNALNDYKNMETIINITPREIVERIEEVSGPRSSATDGMPHTKNIHSGESMLCNALDQRDVLSTRFEQALEFMSWFTPAWLQLSEEEHLLLEAFYMDIGSKTAAVETIAEQLYIERAQIYRRLDKALGHLTILLYGP